MPLISLPLAGIPRPALLTPVSVKKTLLLSIPCPAVLQQKLLSQPLIWCPGSWHSSVSCSPEECFFLTKQTPAEDQSHSSSIPPNNYTRGRMRIAGCDGRYVLLLFTDTGRLTAPRPGLPTRSAEQSSQAVRTSPSADLWGPLSCLMCLLRCCLLFYVSLLLYGLVD